MSDTPAPDLSIVIPSHQRADLLDRCLASVCRHAPVDTEVLVVDDGSRDAAVSRVAARHRGVRTLRLPRQAGFCAAANRGIQAARGRIVELLNDDTEVLPGWADAARAHFDDPAVAAVAPLVLCWPGDRIDSAGDRYYVGGVAAKRHHRRPVRTAQLQPGAVFGASASSAFFRRAALEQVGAFPETFGAYFEDVDLAFRLHRAGYRVQFEPAARVLHHVSSSHGRRCRRLLERQSCNEERVFWRNLPGPALVQALPRHLAVLAAKAWLRWQEGALAPFVLGRLRVLHEVPALVRHRRAIQAFTRCTDLAGWRLEPRYWGTG